jgi:large subunit ribosomal protein L13e
MFQEEEMKMATQLVTTIMPVSQSFKTEKARAITEEEAKFSAFNKLRIERAHQRLRGYREKKAREAAEEQSGPSKK